VTIVKVLQAADKICADRDELRRQVEQLRAERDDWRARYEATK
jgi:FtsZ-binding cell division protein ZapB